MSKVYHTGIFDHSGVISDDRNPVYQAAYRTRRHYQLPDISFEDWIKDSQPSIFVHLQEHGSNVTEEEATWVFSNFYQEVTDEGLLPTMIPGIKETIAELRSRLAYLAIVSMHPIEHLEPELRRYGVIELFDLVSGTIERKADRIKRIVIENEVNPNKVFFVGDMTFDLRAGKEAGVDCFGVTTGYNPREELLREGNAIAVIDSLEELLRYV